MKIFALACQRIDTCPRTYKHTPQSYSSVHAATRTGRNIRSIINERQRAGERKYVRERVQTVCMCIYIYARRFVDVAAADSLCKSSLLARALVSHIRASRPRNALVFKTLARVCGIDPEIYTRAFSMKCPAISARSFFNDSRTLYRAICVCALLPGIMRRVRSPGAKYASGASRAFFQRGDRFFCRFKCRVGGRQARERDDVMAHDLFGSFRGPIIFFRGRFRFYAPACRLYSIFQFRQGGWKEEMLMRVLFLQMEIVFAISGKLFFFRGYL